MLFPRSDFIDNEDNHYFPIELTEKMSLEELHSLIYKDFYA